MRGLDGSERVGGSAERAKSVLLSSEERTKRLTGEMSPETIDGSFTIEMYSQFNTADLGLDDRAYARTRSGNTYRLDRSLSRQNLLKIQNERDGKWEYAVPMPGTPELVIGVGRPLHYAAMNDPDDHTRGGREMSSTEIESIEVWRNYVGALRELEEHMSHVQGESGFSMISAAVKNKASGTNESRDYTKKKTG